LSHEERRGIFDLVEEDEIKLIPAPEIAHVLSLGIDWKKRIIHLTGEISPDSGEWFWTAVEQLGKDSIQVHLNTPGGDVDSMYAIHDAIVRHGKVTVTAYGQVCSAGVLILACAKRRLVTESTILMSHESSGSSGELGYRASKDRRKVDDWQHVYWATLMARYTPHDEKWWRMKTEKTAEYWLLGGKEIVAEGLADELV
jgi:ATP-dependent protease ClpP protease subunit